MIKGGNVHQFLKKNVQINDHFFQEEREVGGNEKNVHPL